MNTRTYLAVDLGASSGRVMAGHFDGSTIVLEEVNRFPNNGVQHADGWHWEATRLFQDIQNGLAEAGKRFGNHIVSVAVDTWGVDYGLIDGNGQIVNEPWMYRDSRTDGMIAEAERLVGAEDMWNRTGIQSLFFNTVYQLMAESRGSAVAKAKHLLFMPDLINYWLSGEMAIERTIASTSQLLKAGSGEWDLDLAAKLGIPTHLLKSTINPGVKLGKLTDSVMAKTGLRNVSVTTCGSHDTASAVAGVPADHANPLFLSSGTWSLLGRELGSPELSEAARAARFSNEQGLAGTTRCLKNIAGMWLLQECKRVWDSQGEEINYATMVQIASSARSGALIDADAPDFEKSCDMPEAITSYIARTGQKSPEGKPELLRVIFESLAMKYRATIENLRKIQPDIPDTVHIVGGGCQNALLNQMTADATGLRVVAGPIEATASGNILAQMLAFGEINSLAEGRQILQRSFNPVVHEPKNTAAWAQKDGDFEKMCALSKR